MLFKPIILNKFLLTFFALIACYGIIEGQTPNIRILVTGYPASVPYPKKKIKTDLKSITKISSLEKHLKRVLPDTKGSVVKFLIIEGDHLTTFYYCSKWPAPIKKDKVILSSRNENAEFLDYEELKLYLKDTILVVDTLKIRYDDITIPFKSLNIKNVNIETNNELNIIKYDLPESWMCTFKDHVDISFAGIQLFQDDNGVNNCILKFIKLKEKAELLNLYHLIKKGLPDYSFGKTVPIIAAYLENEYGFKTDIKSLSSFLKKNGK